MAKWSFLGNHTHSLDDKGRLFLPARFREHLTEEVVISPSQEHCLAVWSMPAFDKYLRSLNKSKVPDVAARKFFRFLTGQSAPEYVDKAGRVSIKPALREWAGLEKEVLIAGAGTHIEIWRPDVWAAEAELAAPSFATQDGPIGTWGRF